MSSDLKDDVRDELENCIRTPDVEGLIDSLDNLKGSYAVQYILSVMEENDFDISLLDLLKNARDSDDEEDEGVENDE